MSLLKISKRNMDYEILMQKRNAICTNTRIRGLGFQNVLEDKGTSIQSVLAAFRRQDEEWKARCEAREREWRESERSLENRHGEDRAISNYLSKIESYHKNKIKDKTLGPMDVETVGRELESVLRGAKAKSMDQFGRGELVGVRPSRELNAVGSPKKNEFPDDGRIGVVVTRVGVSLDKRASVSTASEAIGELGNAEDSKEESSLIACKEVPKAPVDVTVNGLTQDKQQLLDSVTCSHKLEDTCVRIEVTECAEELPCVYANDNVVGECSSGGAAASLLSGDCPVDASAVPRESEYIDAADIDAGTGMHFSGEANMSAIIGEDQYDDFEEEVVIEDEQGVGVLR